MASQPSAAARVFGITELHEKILVHLSPLDLLHAQRVGRVWQDNIRGSTIIQRIIYPEPLTPRFAWIYKWSGRCLDEHLFGLLINNIVSYANANIDHERQAVALSATFNELFLKRDNGDGERSASARAYVGERLVLTEKANEILFAEDAPLSCDEMQLVDIALCELDILLECNCGGPSSSTKCLKDLIWDRLVNPKGLRVKDLRKHARNHVRMVCPRPRVRSTRIKNTNVGDMTYKVSNSILFPTEAEAHWVKLNKKLDVQWCL